jgi:hypothetical protein
MGPWLASTTQPTSEGCLCGSPTRFGSLLFGLSALDLASFLGASGFLGLVALVAGYCPRAAPPGLTR